MDVAVGSRVRIRVSGRRLKGSVTAVIPPPEGKRLLPIDGLSGTIPSFTEATLEVARQVATHYVAPLATVLRRTLPPNVARGTAPAPRAIPDHTPARRVIVSNATTHGATIIDRLASTVERGTSAIVIAPTIDEVTSIATVLTEAFGPIVRSATSASTAAEATRAWVAAATTPGVLVGTREIVLWPVSTLERIVVVEDGRRVMKSPSTPTLDVRDVARMRSDAERADMDILSPVPTLESLAIDPNPQTSPGRLWPLVEVADRTEEPPPAGIVLARTRAAISGTLAAAGTVFVLVPRRGYAPAFRCIRCGTLRRCPACGTAATRDASCRRCGSELGACASCGGRRFEPLGAGIGSVRDALERSFPGVTAQAPSPARIVIGSERDLVGREHVDLAVAVDVDGLTMAPTYRSAEDALRLLVRVAHLVHRGRGARLLVQTAEPHQPVVETLRSGRPEGFLESEAETRRRLGFPPYGQLIALEIDDSVDAQDDVASALEGLATVLGPASMRDRNRWLIRGRDLTEARLALRSLSGRLRDKGARVRIDADPIDL